MHIQKSQPFNSRSIGACERPVVKAREANQIVRCTLFWLSITYRSRSGEIDPHLEHSRVVTLLPRHCLYCSTCLLFIVIDADSDHEIMMKSHLNKNFLDHRQLRNWPYQIFNFSRFQTSHFLFHNLCEINVEANQIWEELETGKCDNIGSICLEIIYYMIGKELAWI